MHWIPLVAEPAHYTHTFKAPPAVFISWSHQKAAWFQTSESLLIWAHGSLRTVPLVGETINRISFFLTVGISSSYIARYQATSKEYSNRRATEMAVSVDEVHTPEQLVGSRLTEAVTLKLPYFFYHCERQKWTAPSSCCGSFSVVWKMMGGLPFWVWWVSSLGKIKQISPTHPREALNGLDWPARQKSRGHRRKQAPVFG